jgi:hypothetical protein
MAKNSKLLRDVPEDVLKIIINEKAEIMKRSNRVVVGFEETIYRIVREWKKTHS